MAPRKKAQNTSRAEAGVVEEDFEPQVQDEVIAEGDFIDFEAIDNQVVPSPVVSAPSTVGNPYMSEEEQNLDMKPQVMGPPPYGSPDPVTSAGKLVPVTGHPFSNLPEDEPARLAEDYGEDVKDYTHAPTETSHPIQSAPATLPGEGEPDGEADSYEEMTKPDLVEEARSRGLEVSGQQTKADVIAALEADDAASEDDEEDEDDTETTTQ